MGAVAMGWFVATAFALAVACCGRDPRAKLCAAYLMSSWAASNLIFTSSSPAETLESFYLLDVFATLVIYVVMLLWPSRWIALLLAGLGAQVAMSSYYQFSEPQQRNDYASFLVNNLLFGVQLVAVTLPTVGRFVPRRRRAPARVKAAIPPPYEGWEPPPATSRGWRGPARSGRVGSG